MSLYIISFLFIFLIATKTVVAGEISTGIRMELEKEAFDFILEKDSDEDFVILTLSDPQVLDFWWECQEYSPEARLLMETVEQLIYLNEPDLILFTGDFTACGEADAFIEFGKYIDEFDIPWTTVWGNHDHSYSMEDVSHIAMPLEEMEKLFTEEFENCLFKTGNHDMGSGNFTIGIRDNSQFIETIFMMDSHTTQEYQNPDGTTFMAEALINETQKQWYREKVELMKQLGCDESIVVTHQPLTGHNLALRDAVEDLNTYYSLLTPSSTLHGVGWKEEYKDTSFGIFGIGCAAEEYGHIHPDDGTHDLFKELKHTKYAICGHCHENNTSILYEGIRYTHGLKTGGCAISRWNYSFNQNGGTIIKIGSEGVLALYHEYYLYPAYFKKEQCHSEFSAPFDIA